ncbi:hypothetical protein ACSS6W_008374 [Trichoderma asperelloides]
MSLRTWLNRTNNDSFGHISELWNDKIFHVYSSMVLLDYQQQSTSFHLGHGPCDNSPRLNPSFVESYGSFLRNSWDKRRRQKVRMPPI